jgi:uncharacterized membrane protein YfcA
LLLKFRSFDDKNEVYKKTPKIISILVGGSIGFISGIVGIGGGIFLSPILLLLNAAKVKHIATTASLFILINSIAGLSGQFTKNFVFDEIHDYWPLFLIVFIGGQIGNFLNIKIFPVRLLALVTAGLVIFVAIRIGFKLFV